MWPDVGYAVIRSLDEMVKVLFQYPVLGIVPDLFDHYEVIIRYRPEERTLERQFLTGFLGWVRCIELEHREEELAVDLFIEVTGRYLIMTS